MKKIFVAVAFLLFTNVNGYSQNKKTMQTLGQEAIKAWEKGEFTGNYDDFEKLMSPSFNFFSHPLYGKFQGTDALLKFTAVIAERKKMPNTLTFTDVEIATNGRLINVSFTSMGKVVGGMFDYAGHNVISFKVNNNKISGFAEYLGDDDLLKFSAMQMKVNKTDIKTFIDGFFANLVTRNEKYFSAALDENFIGIAFIGVEVGKKQYISIHLKQDFIKVKSTNEYINTYNGITTVTGLVSFQHQGEEMPNTHRYTIVIRKTDEGKLLMTNLQMGISITEIKKENIKAFIDNFFQANVKLDAAGMNEALDDNYFAISHTGLAVDRKKYVDVHLKLDFDVMKSSEEIISIINGTIVVTGIVELKHQKEKVSKKQRYTAVIIRSENGRLLFKNYQESTEIKN